MQSNSLPSRNVLVFGSGILVSVFGFIFGGVLGFSIGFVVGLIVGERYYLLQKSQHEILDRIEKLEHEVENIRDTN